MQSEGWQVSADPDRLWRLLPIVLRERDEEEGWPLRALLALISEQADELRAGMWQLYEDHFIETCQPWVIPYLADLVGGEPLAAAERPLDPDTAGGLFPDLAGAPRLGPRTGVRFRADVANTIRYRRRKGTVAVLDALTRDAGGWPAHAVELRERVAVTQHLEHPRPRSGWADLRQVDGPGQVDGPFDPASHTLAIRQSPAEARPALRGLGVFVWRLGAYPLLWADARDVGDGWRRTFSPLGRSAPLFTPGRWDAADAGPVGELDVPQPLTRRLLGQGLAGESPIAVRVNGRAVPPQRLRPASLGPGSPRPAGSLVLVDPVRGRLAVGRRYQRVDHVGVSFSYGFAADLGGGPYDRTAWRLARPAPDPAPFTVGSEGARFASVEDALAAWERAGRPNAIVEILDSRTYELPAATALAGLGWLAIEAAEGERPLLRTAIGGWGLDVADLAGGAETEAVLTLSGVAVEGHLDVRGPLRRLRVLHSTLVPGRSVCETVRGRPGPSLVVRPVRGRHGNRRLRVEVAFSITGTLLVPGEAEGLWLLDSVVDGRGRPAIASYGRGRRSLPAHLERCTVLGGCRAGVLAATDVIVAGRVAGLHQGCVRFSYLGGESGTVDRYASLSGVHGLTPRFTSRRFGDPGYCQLADDCPDAIRRGGSNGAEMGVFNFLDQPHRDDNLVRRLQEYLPLGLERRVVHVT